MTAQPGWRPTHAHLRAAVVGLVLLVVGVVVGRADAVVIAAPLALVTWWSARRPDTEPRASTPLAALTVNEGEEVAWEARVEGLPPGGAAAVVHPGQRLLEVEPAEGLLVAEGADGSSPGSADARIGLRPLRWGRRTLGDPAVAVYDGWYSWRWGPVPLPGMRMTVLPVTAPLAATAPAPHPRGLVGMERASRPGEGTEFAKVRPFAPGDRLRRIHWPVSARTGRLHVTATYADEDAHVVVLIDAVNDVGESTGIDGERSSMDLA